MVLLKSQNHQNLNDKGIRNNSAMKRFCSSLLWTPLLLTMAVALLTGCGGGGSGLGTDTGLQSGVFLDSAVQGLHYETATQSGVTGIDGAFAYREGETIRFYMGDVIIGEAPASQYMTPVDLVPGAIDEMHPMVTNISRFLQTMDTDADPSNGIFISGAVDQEMMGRIILFDMTVEDFANDADVVLLMDALDAMGGGYTGRMMTAPEVAREHMRSTLSEMMQMMNGGHSAVNTGVFLDSAVEGMYYETATRSGVTDAAGTFSYMDGETVQFSMGDVLIGQAPAETFMTPVDLVPGATDETHPTVTNIIRFLQTMDMDADPSNGIFIPESVVNEMQGRHIDFNMSPQAFEMDTDVSMLMDTMGALDPAYAGRMMISSEAAQAHMGETLAGMPGDGGMMNGGNAGDGMSGRNTSNSGGMMNGGNVSNVGGMM